MDRQHGHSIHPIVVALGLAFATTAFGAEAPPESREAVVLHARLAPTVTAEGLSPWSRDFARQAQSDPRLRERLSRRARVEAVNAAVAPLGYVYPAVQYTANGAQFLDDDLNTLPNAFESLIGTSGKHADSDGDGRPDGEELPFAALPVSDPLIADGANPCIPR